MPPPTPSRRPPASPPDDLSRWYERIAAEVEKGLPREQERRRLNILSQDYYRRRGTKLIERRPAESDADFQARIKRSLPITYRAIRVLGRLYENPPQRVVQDDETATDWLADVYEMAQADVLLQEADRMDHLHGMAAIQVGATGDPADPIALTLWSGWHEIVPFEAPGRANRVAACVTIDCHDQQTTYTLWTPDWYRTYVTAKLEPGQTAGGRVAKLDPERSGLNPYGCLPFAFFWHELPTSGIDEQCGLGPFLAEFNAGIDVEQSDMAQAVRAYHCPIPVAYDLDDDFTTTLVPGKFVRVSTALEGEVEGGPRGRLEYLQADLDIAGGWANIREAVDSVLESLGIPLTAYRMEARTLPSGEALLAEQKPLLDYAKGRRVLAQRAETDLARTVLQVYAAYYGATGGGPYPPTAAAAAAATLVLTLLWPPPAIDLPGADRDREDSTALTLGIESPVMVVMRRYNLTREQALAHLKQVAQDARDMARLRPPPVTEPGEDPPPNSPSAETREREHSGGPETPPGVGEDR